MADNLDDDSDLWESPTRNAPLEPWPKTPRTPKTPTAHERQTEPIDREAALRKELDGVRNINKAIEGVIGTLQRAGGNMEAVSKTVTNASTLLNTWTRILSQTEHNQQLILNPDWKGATEDLAEIEAEALRRQQAAQRKAVEEERRREELRRRREEEEEKRRLAASTPARGPRGTMGTRGTRGQARPASRVGSGSGSLSNNTTTSAPSSRGTSGIGRGIGRTRSRYRGER